MSIKKLLYTIFFFTSLSTSYAAESACMMSPEKDIYSPIVIDNHFAVRFQASTTSIEPNGKIYPIIIIAQNCHTGHEEQIAELPYLGDPGKVESAFFADSDFDGKAELFVIHRTTLYSDTGISYSSDYFTTLAYKHLESLTYARSERVSSYFGAGGDVLSSPTSDKLIYEYPYKSESAIKSRLASAQYKAWLERKSITTRIMNKTYLYDQPNIADKSSRYLIVGDEIQVISQKAGWLKAIFKNKKKGDINGWILCRDTLMCALQNPKNPLSPEQTK